MKIVDVAQYSQAWLEARAGVVTASESDAFISPLYKVREAKGVDTYVARKLAEKWNGPLPGAGSWATEQGAIFEEQARNWYEFEHGVEIKQVGFITSDDGRCGCSPDGMLENCGLEIKSPEMATHVKYLLAGQVPPEYRAQVQFSLWVTKWPQWIFVSYCRQMPALQITVAPDPKAQKAIESALLCEGALFYKLDSGWKHLVALNGGKEPPKHEPMTFSNEVLT